jgi:8-oxo-dGTP pyrophosphatase MutT (NUDIX family)
MTTKLDEAAGGLVAARDGDVIRVVLIGVERNGVLRWSLPKGHFKKRESADQAAVREVREETGLRVQIVTALPTIDYWFVEHRVRYHKFVHYFLMRAVGGSFAEHDDEVVDVRWFEWDEALRTMAYANERSVLETERERVAELI